MARLLNLFFRFLYHEFAWAYDLVAWIVSLGQWNNWTHHLLEFLDDGPVLELGYGTGRLQKSICEAGRFSIGLDQSKQMAQITAQRLKKYGLSQNLIIGDGRNLPFLKQSISQVLATFPTEYLFELQTLQEISRILHPGGRLIILPFVTISGSGTLHKILAWIYRITGQSPDINIGQNSGLNDLFLSAGFIISTNLIEKSFYTLEIVEARLLLGLN